MPAGQERWKILLLPAETNTPSGNLQSPH